MTSRFLAVCIALCVSLVPVCTAAASDAAPKTAPKAAPKALSPQATVAHPGGATQPFVVGVSVPPRERELLRIFEDTSKLYRNVRTDRQRIDVRLGMQSRILDYMEISQDAVDWVGRVKEVRSTPEGDRWIEVRIAPRTTISTFQTHLRDSDQLTLIPKGTALWGVIDTLQVGQPVIFSARMLTLFIDDDQEMIEQPHLIARFKSVRPIDTGGASGN